MQTELRRDPTVFSQALVQNGPCVRYATAALGAATRLHHQFAKGASSPIDSLPYLGVTYRIADANVHVLELS